MPRLRATALLALCGLTGCGGSEEDSYKLVTVTGKITKDGKPLPNATVSFIPAAGNKNQTPGGGQTGSEGTYSLMFKGKSGVSPGKYKVIVEPAIGPPPGANVRPEYKDDPIAYHLEQLAVNKAKGRGAPKPEVVRSEFEAEVEDVGSTTVDYDIKASAPGKPSAKN